MKRLSGLLLGTALCPLLAWAAPPRFFSPSDLKTLQGADGLLITLSCYFGEGAKACPPASHDAPQWLRDDLPSMRARDCQQGATTEARAWSSSLGDIGYFLHQARAVGEPPPKPKSKKAKAAKAPDPKAALPGLRMVRDGFARRLAMMQARGFERSLRGRGGDFLGRFRFIQEKMETAVAGLEAGNMPKFQEAALAVAWQAQDLKTLFHSEPSNPYAESGVPDCVGLDAYTHGGAPIASPEELARLTKLGANYRGAGDFAKAQAALSLALPMAEQLGDAVAQETLHAAVADCWMKLNSDERALPHMEKALALARARGDLVSERDLLKTFAGWLAAAGKDDDVRANYEEQAAKAQGRIATALDGYKRGEAFFAQGRYQEAKREYLETGQLGHALSYVRVADCELKLANPEGAVAADQEALKLARLQGKKTPEAMALYGLAAIYSDQGNTSAAMDTQESLIRLGLAKDRQELPADWRWRLERERAAALATLENLYNLADRWDRAGRFFEEVRLAALAQGRRDDALRSEIYGARALVASGSPEKAAAAFEDALRTAVKGEGLEADTLEFLHRSLFAVQPYWTAEIRAFALQFNRHLADLRKRRFETLDADLAAARKKRDRLAELQALYGLGAAFEADAHVQLGRALEEGSTEADAVGKAIGDYDKALDLAARLRRQDYQVACWRGLARMHAARQDFDPAVESLERALTTVLWHDGRTLHEADPGLKALDSAIQLKLGDAETVGELLRELGYAALGQGVPVTAMDYIRRSLAAQTNELSRMRTLVDFAKLLDGSGYQDQSAEFLERLLSEGRVEGAPRLKATVLMSLAGVQRKTGELGEDFALARLEEALNLLQPRGLNTRDIPLLLALGDLRLKKGKVAGAAEAYESAIAISEQFRAALASESARLAFLEKDPTHILNYQIAIGGMFACAAKDPAFTERAFAAAEKARSRVLLESLRGAALEREGPLRHEEIALTQRLAMMAQKGLETGFNTEDAIAFASLQERLAQLGGDIRHKDPQYATLRYGQPSGLKEVAAALRPGEAFVSYKFAGREGSAWAFLLKAGGAAKLIRLDAVSALETLKDLPPPAPRRATEAWEIVPERLGRALWAPFEAELKDAKKVFIVPDDGLWTVPWSALESGGQSLLDKDYTVQVVPSGSVLVQLRNQKRAKTEGEVAAFAPFSGRTRSKYPQIAGAKEVLDNLKWMFPGAQTFSPPEATKERAIEVSGNFRYVVYYTHGLADETNPWLSSVFFTDASGKDDPLTVTEAMRRLKLEKTDLIVLAACESARGQLSRGEGVMGLTRGLFYAGAKGVISTGWSVAEASSRDIVIGTFQGIHLGLEPAKALQMAQRDVRKRMYGGLPGAHPFFWAGFQVYGDPE